AHGERRELEAKEAIDCLNLITTYRCDQTHQALGLAGFPGIGPILDEAGERGGGAFQAVFQLVAADPAADVTSSDVLGPIIRGAHYGALHRLLVPAPLSWPLYTPPSTAARTRHRELTKEVQARACDTLRLALLQLLHNTEAEDGAGAAAGQGVEGQTSSNSFDAPSLALSFLPNVFFLTQTLEGAKCLRTMAVAGGETGEVALSAILSPSISLQGSRAMGERQEGQGGKDPWITNIVRMLEPENPAGVRAAGCAILNALATRPPQERSSAELKCRLTASD
ncbi:unnamed protein product, partial [Discosporangium mesarthrocarpum]